MSRKKRIRSYWFGFVGKIGGFFNMELACGARRARMGQGRVVRGGKGQGRTAQQAGRAMDPAL
jgi:hypothetical protein